MSAPQWVWNLLKVLFLCPSSPCSISLLKKKVHVQKTNKKGISEGGKRGKVCVGLEKTASKSWLYYRRMMNFDRLIHSIL